MRGKVWKRIPAGILAAIHIDGADKQIVSFAGYTLYLVNAHSKYPQAAVQPAAYLTGQENQVKAFKDRGFTLKRNGKTVVEEGFPRPMSLRGSASVSGSRI
ncbi:MAG: hypothetical protein LKJ21_07110 [Oscillospiraceae bacterium]|jgi:hypothetical protein|nr:hypothetical protein [Oscillospiraceae bacterium]MCI1990424.1 hypothetical protein [Oscillospiraceae bacterium]MCI2035181.1 hypothetical protein [Oscillospiraceae bacterium]